MTRSEASAHAHVIVLELIKAGQVPIYKDSKTAEELGKKQAEQVITLHRMIADYYQHADDPSKK